MQIYIGDIITDCRDDSNNGDDIPSSTSITGITDEAFLRYARWAQERLQGLITKVYPYAFLVQKEIDIQADVRDYSIPDNIYLGTKIVLVEFSPTGEVKDYFRLPPANFYDPISFGGVPYRYTRLNGQVSLQPTPSQSTGKIRVTFVRALNRVDIRRGTVDARTINGSNQLTALSIDPTGVNSARIAANTHLCVSDSYGNVTAYNIPYSSYNAGTGDFTLVGTPTLPASETIAVGSFITLGKYTATHSSLPDDCARYMTEYMTRRIGKRERNSSVPEIDVELRDMEKEIVASFKVADNDIKYIPIINHDIMFTGYDLNS